MRILRLLGWAFVLLAFVACSSDATPVQSNDSDTSNVVADNVEEQPVTQNDTSNQTGATNAPQATVDSANVGLAARVNGVPITIETFQAEVARSPLVAVAANQTALEQDVLRQLIEKQLIEQSAPALGVTVTEADIDAEVQTLRSIAVSEAQWEQFLAQNQFESEAELRTAQSDVLLNRKVQDALISQYLGTVEQVNARHIVVDTLEIANEVLGRLQSGEGFAELAAIYSIDSTTRETGGNLGWFARNELFYSNLEDVAFSLNIGDIGGPVQTSIGYHIIQILDKQQRAIEAERLPMLAENVVTNWLAEQYNNSAIEIYLNW